VRDSASLESVRSKLTQLHAALGSAGAAAAVAAGGTSESFAKPPSNVPMPVEGEATALAGEIVELVSASFKQTEKFSSFAKNSIFFLFFFFFFFFFSLCKVAHRHSSARIAFGRVDDARLAHLAAQRETPKQQQQQQYLIYRNQHM
jgi:hypothetical protein